MVYSDNSQQHWREKMSVDWRYQSFREDLESGILDSLESVNEDHILDFFKTHITEAMSENNTYDGEHLEAAEFQDAFLKRLKGLCEHMLGQTSRSASDRAFSEMFCESTERLSKLTDPTWEKIMGRNVNKIA